MSQPPIFFMILSIFTLWLIAAFVLSFYGYYTKSDMFRIFGAALFVILGLTVEPATSNLFGPLQYEYTYTVTQINGTTSQFVEPQYSNYQSHVIGFYLALLGSFSIYNIFMDRREVGKD